jgi:hypothetical protein
MTALVKDIQDLARSLSVGRIDGSPSTSGLRFKIKVKV